MAEEITRVSNSANLQRKRQRKGVHTKVEEALFNWFNQQRTKNALLSSDVLLNKAKEFAILLKDDFDPVQSWLWRWRQRYGIKFKRFHGEGKENDEVSAASFKNEFLPNILKNRKIDDIFNADESALLYKALPNATFMTNCEKPTGWKTQKSRLTLLFLCNATGTFKKIYTIGKFKNPRCFKKRNPPLPYFANVKAWMTSTLWSEIIQELDNDMVAKDKNILLFVDNASCHKINFKPRNIEIEFLPPNTTALIQPLDQGIIHAFKAEYRKILVRKQISAIERGVPLQTYIKSISILDVLHYIKRAWWLVKPETICNCFKKVRSRYMNATISVLMITYLPGRNL